MKLYTHKPIELPELEAEMVDGERFYKTPSGIKYPSVTTVLSAHSKQGILEWRRRVGAAEANRVSAAASGRGNRFHNSTEKYLKNEPIEHKSVFDQEIFEAAKPVLHRIDNILVQEKALYSKHLRLAGRVDCIAEFDGKLSVIDFKTATREKEEAYIQHYFMQAAAYAIMCEARTKIPVSHLVIIIATEDGIVQVFEGERDDYVEQLLYYRDLFEAA